MALDTPTLTVELEELANQPPQITQEIKSYRLSSDYTTPTDGWEFVVYSEDDPAALRRLYSPLQPIRLSVAGNLQVIGRIDHIEGTGEGNTALRVQGRDYIADIVTGSVDPAVKFKKTQDIGDAILSVVRVFGVVTVANMGGNLTRNILTGASPYKGAPARDYKQAKLDEFKPSYNEGAFEICNKIAARHGFTIQPAMRRDWLVLAEPEYRQTATYQLSRTRERKTTDTILHGTASRDYSRVPTLTSATGRSGQSNTQIGTVKFTASTFGKGAPSPIGQNAEVRRIVYSADARSPRVLDLYQSVSSQGVPGNANMLYRPLFYQDKDSRNVEQLERGVRRQIAERLRDTLVYRCTVRGHVDPDSGATYAVDTIAQVDDDVEDVHEELWIHSREFDNDGNSGPLTHLELIRPGSYVL